VPERVFVAIELPAAARALLAAATECVLGADPAWRDEKPVPAALLHVTLAFVGRVPDPEADAMLERLRAVAARVDPFTLSLSGVRAVPSAGRASMVWATLDGDGEQAASLAAGLAQAAGLDGLERPFRAHVTLARARRPRRSRPHAIEAASALLSEASKDADRIVSVRSVTVFSSTLGGAGPTYRSLARLVLAQPDGAATGR
jgi:2'-5' RNA ligase